MASTSKILIENNKVTKEVNGFLSYGVVDREVKWLKILNDSRITPKIINNYDNVIEMEYVGNPLIPYEDYNVKESLGDYINRNQASMPEIPEDWEKQVDNILKVLKEHNCSHNDIKPWDICVKDGKLYLIDFQWATNIDDEFPLEWPDVGGEFKKGHRIFDDEYSLKKSIKTIIELNNTTHKIVIFCKSYIGDLDRVKVQLESIIKHNKDNIPYYISVPLSDKYLFIDKLGSYGYNIISDEEIIGDSVNESWVKQQIVKSEFWKTGISKNYVMIDSDSYFIKDFFIKDFMYNDNTPYTVMHECKDLLQFTSRNNMSFVKKGFVEDRLFVQDIFDRKGRSYDFGPSPTIWSSEVWKSLKENYLDKNNLTFSNLIEVKSCEFHWYGEWLLKMRPIDIVPIEPLFKVFHYKEQYDECKRLGDTEDSLSENFLGIVLQSNWGAPFKYE